MSDGAFLKTIIQRKELDRLISESMEDGVLNVPKLLEKMEITPGGLDKINVNNSKLKDLLSHTALKHSGLTEDQSLELLNLLYPETKHIRGGVVPTEGLIKKEHAWGIATTPGLENFWGRRVFANPLESKIQYDPSVNQNKSKLAALLAHEGQHIRDAINTPGEKSFAVPEFAENDAILVDYPSRISNVLTKNKKLAQELLDEYNRQNNQSLTLDDLTYKNEIRMGDAKNLAMEGKRGRIYLNSPNVTPLDSIEQYSGRHHIEYPINYELQKAEEIINNGIKISDENSLVNKMKEQEKEFNKKLQEVAEKEALKKLSNSNSFVESKTNPGLLGKAFRLADIYQTVSDISKGDIVNPAINFSEAAAPKLGAVAGRAAPLLELLRPTEMMTEDQAVEDEMRRPEQYRNFKKLKKLFSEE